MGCAVLSLFFVTSDITQNREDKNVVLVEPQQKTLNGPETAAINFNSKCGSPKNTSRG